MAASAQKNPFLSGLLLGLLIGVGLSVAVAVLVTRNNPFVSVAPQSPAQQPVKAGATTPADAPRYEFDQTPTTQPGAEVQTDGYFLQAGAFKNAAEADQMKARLALIGLEAKVAYAAGAETPLYRVQLGPYKGLDELNAARARLTQNGIDTILIKISHQPTTPAQDKP